MNHGGDPPDAAAPEGLGTVSKRRRDYALLLAQGVPSAEAARRSGFSPSYAKKLKRHTKDDRSMQAAFAQAEAIVKEVAQYDVTAAFAEIAEFIEFAKARKNPMAVFKAVELKARLAGLLIERREIVTVDITGALEDARRRVGPLPTLALPVSDDRPTGKGTRSKNRSPSGQNDDGGGVPGGGGPIGGTA